MGFAAEGALVQEVVAGSPAAAAGLAPCRRGSFGELVVGDLITAVDGTAVRQVEDLISYILGRKPGDEVVLTVRRGGEASRTVRLRTTLVARDELRRRTSSAGRSALPSRR